jgi:hypothetical protein
MNIKLNIVFLFSLAVSSASFAQRFGEPYRHFLGFTLCQDSLSSVQRILGTSPFIEQGNQGEWTRSIDYFSPELKTVISFNTNDLGSGTILQGFSIKSETDNKANLPLLYKITGSLSIGHLTLGMSSHDFNKALGSAVKWRSNRASVILSGQDTTTNRIYDISISIVGLFDKDRLEELHVWMTRTY